MKTQKTFYSAPFTYLRKGQETCNKADKVCVDLYKGIDFPGKVLVIFRALTSGKWRMKLLAVLKWNYACLARVPLVL